MYDKYYRVGSSVIVEGNDGEWPLYDDCYGDIDKKVISINKIEKLEERERELNSKKSFFTTINNIANKFGKHVNKILAAYTGIALLSMLGMVIEMIVSPATPIMGSVLFGSTIVTVSTIGLTKLLSGYSNKKIKNTDIQLGYITAEIEKENQSLTQERSKEYTELVCHEKHTVDPTDELKDLRAELLLIKDYSENRQEWKAHMNDVASYVNQRHNTSYKEEDKPIQKVKSYINEKTTK